MSAMAKRRKNRKKKQKKPSSPIFYIIGIIILIVILTFAMFRPQDSKLKTLITKYISHKQHISRIMGKVIDYKLPQIPKNPTSQSQHKLSAKLISKNGAASLDFTIFQQKQEWFLKNILLNFKNKTYKLSPLFVEKRILRSASASSTPIQKPTFVTGEDIHIEYILSGIPRHKNGIHINQSITLLEKQQNQYVVSATMDKPIEFKQPVYDKSITIKNRIQTTEENNYIVRATFVDELNHYEEIFDQKVIVKELVDRLKVNSVNYFKDSEFKKRKKDSTYKSGEQVYLIMKLDGFIPDKNNIAGEVDLKVKNSLGETIANQPKFATFKQKFKKDHHVIVSGAFKISEPDIYFLEFTIKDFFSEQKTKHKEKLIITLRN